MTSILKPAAAGIALTLCAGTANAAVIICTTPNCAPGTFENVLVDSASGMTATGHTNNTNVTVNYTSSTDNLVVNSQGQADVSSADNLLSSLTFSLAGGSTFAAANFNLFPLPGNQSNEATSAFINYVIGGTPGQQTVSINTNGQNFLGIYGTAGELFTSVGFAANPQTTGIQDMRQLRLASVSPPIPEPGTWVMMLLGIAGAGIAIRRSRRGGGQLLQLA